MRRAIVTIAAVAVMVVAYGSNALGADSDGANGELRFMGTQGCSLEFGVYGFQRGTPGTLQLTILGSSYTFNFSTSSQQQRQNVDLKRVLKDVPHPVLVGVSYHLTVAETSISGSTTAECICGDVGGGGGGGGGSGGGGGGGTGSVPDATPASPVASQPGFAG